MIGGVILAAGMSKRMGTVKLTLELADQMVIEHVLKNALDSELDNIIVIFSKYTEEVKKAANALGLDAIENHYAEMGMSTSVRLGVQHFAHLDGIIFLLGDQPFVKADIINRLAERFTAEKDKIIVPVNKKGKGNPVIFPKRYFSEILSIQGDTGPRGLLEKYSDQVVYVDIPESAIQFDIDTAEDMDRAKALIED